MNVNNFLDSIYIISDKDKIKFKDIENISMVYTKISDFIDDFVGTNQRIKNCRMGGYTDWRLPTAYELKTLLSEEFKINSKIGNSVMENDFLKNIYTFLWTSSLFKTEDGGNGHVIFVINVKDGKLKSFNNTEDWRYGGMYTCARCIMVR